VPLGPQDITQGVARRGVVIHDENP
jgi:hypothetical protein